MCFALLVTIGLMLRSHGTRPRDCAQIRLRQTERSAPKPQSRDLTNRGHLDAGRHLAHAAAVRPIGRSSAARALRRRISASR